MVTHEAPPAHPSLGISLDDPRLAAVLRRVPTQARAQEKVHRALAAAQALLDREGAEALTLTRVAGSAGVSAGALHQYLPDREAIVAALSVIYHARHEAVLDALVAAADRHGDATARVHRIVMAFAELYREHTAIRALAVGPTHAAYRAATREHKERMVRKTHALLVARGLVGAGSSDVVARTVFFAADGVMHEAFALDGGGDPALLAHLEHLLGVYLRAAESVGVPAR
ncbi:TetR/AcrR family transcriptional regulator [Patulibacter sp. S7RM1-6]